MAAKLSLPFLSSCRVAVGFRLVVACLIAALPCACSKPAKQATEAETHPFEESEKSGDLSFAIVGDYFNHRYVVELARLAQTLSPGARQIYLCTPEFERALDPLLAKNHIENVETVPVDHSLLMTQWARDIFVAGTEGDHKIIIASPYKNGFKVDPAWR